VFSSLQPANRAAAERAAARASVLVDKRFVE
jgi:hypothetical protein